MEIFSSPHVSGSTHKTDGTYLMKYAFQCRMRQQRTTYIACLHKCITNNKNEPRCGNRPDEILRSIERISVERWLLSSYLNYVREKIMKELSKEHSQQRGQQVQRA
jgi:hypothetical protein